VDSNVFVITEEQDIIIRIIETRAGPPNKEENKVLAWVTLRTGEGADRSQRPQREALHSGCG
jgi:hypothetical protein